MNISNTANEFKKFINKGNIFDLAIGIIIGTTFTAVVNSLANDIILPLISRAINFDISSAMIILKEAEVDADGNIIKAAIEFRYGNFFQKFLNFIIIALAIFIAIKVVNKVKDLYIRHQISYVKKLKNKRPDWFDEDDEYGKKLYEKLKKEYPQYFKEEIKLENENNKPEIKEDPQVMMINILKEINTNLENLKKEETKVN